MAHQLLANSTLLSSMHEAHNRSIFPACCGVYCIHHRKSGKLYIGSSCGKLGIRSRLQSHISHLRAGDSCSPHLQCYFDKYGAKAFDIYLVEETSPDDARARERFYLQEYKPWIDGFNSMKSVDDAFRMGDGSKAKLARHNSKPFELEHEGVIYSGTNLTAFSRERDLHQGAMTQVLLGKKRQFKGWTLPGKAALPVELKYHPTGEIFEVPYFGITAFAKKRGVAPCSLSTVVTGRSKIMNGWALKDTHITKEDMEASMLTRAEKSKRNGQLAKLKTAKAYDVIKDGVRFTGTNRYQFCLEHGMQSSAFSALCLGKLQSCRGFTLYA